MKDTMEIADYTAAGVREYHQRGNSIVPIAIGPEGLAHKEAAG